MTLIARDKKSVEHKTREKEKTFRKLEIREIWQSARDNCDAKKLEKKSWYLDS